MDEIRRLRRNFRLYYASEFFANSYFTLPIYVLFGREYLGISYFQVGLLFVVMLVANVSFDFVTGVIADRWGRKRTFAVGMLLQIAGILPFVFVKEYWVLLVSLIVGGIGVAMYSSTLDAQIYDEAKKAGALKQFQHVNANKQVFTFAGRIWASIIGGLAYKVHPTLPYALTAFVFALSLLAGFLMRFEAEVKGHETLLTRKQHFVQVFNLVRKAPALVKFLLVSFISVTAGDLLFGYYHPYYIGLRVSSSSLGFLFAGISVTSMLGSYLMRKIPDKLSPHTIQGIKLLGVAMTAAILYTLKLPLVFFAPLILGLPSGFMQPNLRLYVNKHAPNELRASILSLAMTVFTAGTALGFLVAFFLADKLQPRQVLSIIIAVSIIGLAINVLIRPKEVYIDKLDSDI